MKSSLWAVRAERWSVIVWENMDSKVPAGSDDGLAGAHVPRGDVRLCGRG